VSDLTSSAGTALGWSEYAPYGAVRLAGTGAGAPASNPFAFSGEQRDGLTGLYHLRARQYDPTTGRFLTTDPRAPLLTDPYVASYVYVGNRPTGFVDPSGEILILVVGGLLLSGFVGYVASNTAFNAFENVVNDRPLLYEIERGFTVHDAVISAGAGLVSGPIGGVSSVAARMLLGAGLGIGATVMSQEIGGRECLAEGQTGAVGGALTSALPPKFKGFKSALFGLLVNLAQGAGTAFGCGDASAGYQK
jgi:RHS repeat-associated protein